MLRINFIVLFILSMAIICLQLNANRIAFLCQPCYSTQFVDIRPLTIYNHNVEMSPKKDMCWC